jgi:hypothetical protein
MTRAPLNLRRGETMKHQLQLALDDDIHAYVGEGRHEFKAWLAEADLLCLRQTGVSIFDLADMPYDDWYEDGMSPKEAVRELLEEEGY